VTGGCHDPGRDHLAAAGPVLGAHRLGGGSGVELQLREWVNSGLMTFFFFVVGLEARREFDLGRWSTT
jgi:hypothetical protein